jgi:hypothetical protein
MMNEIEIWAQMFFDDGSVSQGIRVSAYVLDDNWNEIQQIAVKLLQSVNRTEGFLLLWGAGNIFHRQFRIPAISDDPISFLV